MSLMGIKSFRRSTEKAVQRWQVGQVAAMEAHRRATRRRFAQNRVLGPPLSASTIRRKKSSVKLVDTGRLARSPRVRYVNRRVVMLVSNVFYAGFHQYGTKKTPMRKFFFFLRRDLQVMAKVFLGTVTA